MPKIAFTTTNLATYLQSLKSDFQNNEIFFFILPEMLLISDLDASLYYKQDSFVKHTIKMAQIDQRSLVTHKQIGSEI